MIIQVRCKSCGKPIAHLYEEFIERSAKKDSGAVLTDLGVTRYCCRSQLLTHTNLADIAAEFKKF